MATSMKKIANDVVTSLKLIPSPEKKGKTFWDYLKEQLYSDSTWDQNDLKVIEKEIDKHLSTLPKAELTELWERTDAGMDKLDGRKKVDSSEMKEDLIGDILGQVMDRMDDNYSGTSVYQQTASIYSAESENASTKKKEIDEESDIEKDPKDLIEEELDLNDEDIFNDEDFPDEEEDHI